MERGLLAVTREHKIGRFLAALVGRHPEADAQPARGVHIAPEDDHLVARGGLGHVRCRT